MDSRSSSPCPPTNREATNREQRMKGHTRTYTPVESPLRAARPPVPPAPGCMHNLPSTPAHGNAYGFSPGTPLGGHNIHHGSRMVAELNTPVISNANTKYVDDDRETKGTPPSKLGLPRAVIDKSTSYGISPKSPALSLPARGRPQPFLKQSDENSGLGVMNSLAMPSGLYSDDSSLEEDVTNESILRPVELKSNRFHSFQTSSQYERKKISKPMTLSPAIEHPNTISGVTASSGQYISIIRNAHGVKELSDTKDLDAIFKADRPTPLRSTEAIMNAKMVSPMSVDDEDNIEKSRPGAAIPIDDRELSIPSIRLANRINTFGSYHTLFSDEEDYTDDGGSSLEGSYIDDDDASLSSKESHNKMRRWRRMSDVLRRDSQTQGTSDKDDDMMMHSLQVTRKLPTAFSDLDDSEPLAGASLLEQRFGEIAINNTSNSPILDTNALSQSIDDDAIDYNIHSQGRRRHKRKGRSHSHNSEAALEWLRHLQQNYATDGGQIIEAASSKFLTGTRNATETSENQDTKALGMAHPLCRSSTIEAGGFAYSVGALKESYDCC